MALARRPFGCDPRRWQTPADDLPRGPGTIVGAASAATPVSGGAMGLGLRGLGRNVGTTLARQTLAVGLGLVLTVALARALGPEGTGQVGLVMFFANVWVTLFGLGLPAANAYLVGREAAWTAAAVRFSERLGVGLALGGVVAGLAFAHVAGARVFPTVAQPVLLLAMAVFPVMLLEAMLLGVLQGREDFGTVNRIGILVPCVTLALVLALVVGQRLGVRGALLAYAGAHAVGMAASLRAAGRRADGARSGGHDEYAEPALRYGLKANPGNLIALANYRIDLYLLNLLASASAVGIYAAAVQIAEKLWLLSAAVSYVLLPRLASLHRAESERRRITPLMARWVLLATVGLAAGVGVLGYPLIHLMGPRFAAAFPVLLWLLPGVALLAVARVVGADLAARGRPELNVAATLAAVAIEVPAVLLLVPRMGVPGAAAASSLAYGSHLVAVLLFYSRVTGVRPWTPLVPTGDDRRMAAALAALLGGWLRSTGPGDRMRG